MKAVIDIETGGFSKEKNGICEIGMVAINKSNIEIDSLQILIKPYLRAEDVREGADQLVSYKDDAMSVHGITVDQLLVDGVEPTVACELIVDFINKHDITSFIGHNIESFDKKWLIYFFSRFSSYDFIKVIELTECTMKLSKDKVELSSYSLENICVEFGINNHEAHRSIGDCRATLEVYKALMLY